MDRCRDEREGAVPIKGAIFDCDGTLLDSMGVWRSVEADLARRVGHELTDAERDALCTFTLAEAGRFFHCELGVGMSPGHVVDLIKEAVERRYTLNARPRPGALAFVRRLWYSGVRCAVATSSPHGLVRGGLTAGGFASHLDFIVSTDDVGASKREPAAYDRALLFLGTPREFTWVFEDSAYALRTARAAGYRTVGIWDCDASGTFEELSRLADIAVRSWDELDALYEWGALDLSLR